MCKSCNAFSWNNNYLISDAASFGDAVTSSQLAAFGLAGRSLETALQADGVGDDPAPAMALAPTVVTVDTVPDGITGTNPVVTVGGPHVYSTTDTPGDQDFYKVELQAGVKYNIGMYGHPGGPSGVPQPDAFIELYDAAGNMIAYEDGKGRTPGGELYGLDAMLTITVATTGTYYINARAFDQEMDDDTTTGDTVGDYDLFVEVNTDPPEPVATSYYPITSPLHSIDWGSQVDGTVRNPDGNEGTAPTGNPQGTPDAKGATVGYWGQSTEGKNVIKIYFAKAGDVYTPEDPTDPGAPPAIVAVGAKDFEITAIWISLREFEKVADIVYVETQNREEADFHYVTYSGTPGPGISLLGSMNPPQESDEGLAQFNSGDYRWSATNLQQGGFSFVTLIHEFGHGHGLAHPHDTGGESSRMPGVKAIINTPAGPVPEPTNTYPNYTRGEFDLNQGVFTMMSYQDGWETSPYGRAPTDVGYGYLGGLMALDIAVIQGKYGVNEDWATGNDVYTLKDVNAAGTFYSSIWDGGGIDEIRYDGARDSSIDLRAATLLYEVGGGGWVSYAWGIHGGFTIANGVTIENATTGSGNDKLRGNSVANVLDGGAGADLLLLQDGGDDSAVGGSGNDSFYFGGAFTTADTVNGGDGADAIILQGNYSAGMTLGTGSVSSFSGLESISLAPGNFADWGDTANNSYSYNLTAIDANVPAGGILRINGHHLRSGENLTFNGALEQDGRFFIFGGLGVDNLTGGSGNDIFVFGHDGRFGSTDVLHGGPGYDSLYLRGDYNLDFTQGGFGIITGIESLTLGWASDSQFVVGGDGEFDYNLVWDDAMLADDARITVNGSGLAEGETMIFDGSDEAGGDFRLFGGSANDAITGGGGDDLIYGGYGADQLRGNGGADVYRYQETWDSYADPGESDTIQGFTPGVDLIDLSIIDANVNVAGDQAFRFTGAEAFAPFGNSVGQLRAFQIDAATNTWRIEADVSGDGSVDFMLQVVVEAGQPLTAADFIL